MKSLVGSAMFGLVPVPLMPVGYFSMRGNEPSQDRRRLQLVTREGDRVHTGRDTDATVFRSWRWARHDSRSVA
jgi:hypothetical protein